MGIPQGSAFDLKQLATPTANPAAGAQLLYFKSDSNLYTKSSAGSETQVGSTSWEPILSAGTTAQYYRGDKSWQTLNVAAVSGAAPLASPTFTGTVGGITKAMVGLTSVDDTSDTAKPVSTAQQTALNLKANLASPTFTGTVTVPTPSAGTDATTKAYVDITRVVAQGGTGFTAAAFVRGPVIAGTTSTAALRTVDLVGTGRFLMSNGTGSDPTFEQPTFLRSPTGIPIIRAVGTNGTGWVASSSTTFMQFYPDTTNATAAMASTGTGHVQLSTDNNVVLSATSGTLTWNAAEVLNNAGVVNVNRIGSSGTRDATTVLYGDNTWKTAPGESTRTVAQGGTGRVTSTTAYGLLAAGTTATGVHQTLATGTTGQILKSNGSASLPTFQTGAAADVGLGNVTNNAQVTLATVTTKGDLLAATGSAAVTRLAAGTNGFVLSANSAQATGLEWIAAASGGGAKVQGTEPVGDPEGALWWDTSDNSAVELFEAHTFSVTGNCAVAAGPHRFYVEANYTIISVRAAVGTQPTGAALIVDVNKNGTTIYGTQANRPTIAVSTSTDTGGTFSTTTMAAGDYITVDIDQIGSTIPGADLTVTVRVKRTS